MSVEGNFPKFFSLLSQRLDRLFKFNECQVQLSRFGPWLESESLSRFKFSDRKTLDTNIQEYFNAQVIESLATTDALADQDEQEARSAEKRASHLELLLNPPPIGLGAIRVFRFEVKDPAKAKKNLVAAEVQAKQLRAKAEATREQRKSHHYRTRIIERISVLESILHILPNESDWYGSLIRDIRRFFVESEIMLNIHIDEGRPSQIVPLDEPLLQSNVTDNLLPRLFEKFPDRARELVRAYHDFLGAKDGDTIFIEAFKSLEQLARDLTGDPKFLFDKSHLDKHFSSLHGSIRQTLIRLDGHRGDKGGHGKNAPPAHEVRYLLFAICNAALLLLDYPNASVQD